jgi:pyruvate kinase
MRRYRQAKIIATLGPRTQDLSHIRALYHAGVDVFRLNFSHGTHEQHRKTHQLIRQVEQESNHPIAIMADLQGPKFRIGSFQTGQIDLKKGQKFIFDLDPTLGDHNRVQFPHPEIIQILQVDNFILVRDGQIRLQVIQKNQFSLETIVRVGGEILNHQGVNLPLIDLPHSELLTEKDQKDLDFSIQLGVDWIALSFVQTPNDIQAARALMTGAVPIVAKIEKPKAIECLEEIIAVSDGIMIARGDLGIEIPLERVPSLQKKIIQMCRRSQKPVIVATQMLESMTHSPIPTRAEVSDVATAIYEGVDAVMLSAESAIGIYPIESVKMMDKIIKEVEKDPLYRQNAVQDLPILQSSIAGAVTVAAREVVATIPIAAVVILTRFGKTATQAAAQRPNCSIVALTPEICTARSLSLVWGIYPILIEPIQDFSGFIGTANTLVRKHQFAQLNDWIVLTAGFPLSQHGLTNMIWIEKVVEFFSPELDGLLPEI